MELSVSGICLRISDAHRCLARRGTRAGTCRLPDAANQDLRSLTSLCLHEPFRHRAGLLQRMGSVESRGIAWIVSKPRSPEKQTRLQKWLRTPLAPSE